MVNRTPAAAQFSAAPWVMLFLGVNGVGKTTTIGKMAEKFRRDGKKVLLVADRRTFLEARDGAEARSSR